MTPACSSSSDEECCTTVFEASHRIGGKLHTRKFSKVDAAYESGVAECYGDASGDDPLRSLVADLRTVTMPTSGSTVVMLGHIYPRRRRPRARRRPVRREQRAESFRAISARALSIDEWRGRLPSDSPAESRGSDDRHRFARARSTIHRAPLPCAPVAQRPRRRATSDVSALRAAQDGHGAAWLWLGLRAARRHGGTAAKTGAASDANPARAA